MFNNTQTRDYPRRSETARLFVFAALMCLLGACANKPQPLHLADNVGNAVRQNIAAQLINPQAAGPDESDRIDGQSAERALESRRTRSVESAPDSLVSGVGGGN